MRPPGERGDGDERLDRAVSRAGTETGERGVDAVRTLLDRDDRVGDGEPEVVVCAWMPIWVSGRSASR